MQIKRWIVFVGKIKNKQTNKTPQSPASKEKKRKA